MPSATRALFSKRMLIIFLMGFSSGLPLLLIGSTLKAWLTTAGVDLTIIGLFSLVGIPYGLKFLWAPVLDYIEVFGIGRRRDWLLLTQCLLIAGLLALSFSQPKTSMWAVSVMVFIIAFLSATQDIAVDAYRTEYLATEELGLGSAVVQYGYRLAMLVAGALPLYLADRISWKIAYMVMAACMLIGLLTTLWAPEPEVISKPRDLKSAFIDPLFEFLKRKNALSILLFIIFYKIGESMASDMYTPFYIKLGFKLTEIAVVAKTVALPATLLGLLIGGLLMINMGIMRSLFWFGVLQGVALLTFAWLATIGPHLWLLGAAVVVECFTSALASAAFVAFLSALCEKRFTATQYALFSSLAAEPRVLAGASTGWLAKHFGWHNYFIFCTLLTIPALIMIFIVQRLPDVQRRLSQ